MSSGKPVQNMNLTGPILTLNRRLQIDATPLPKGTMEDLREHAELSD